MLESRIPYFFRSVAPVLLLGFVMAFAVFSRGGVTYWAILGGAFLIGIIAFLGFFGEQRKNPPSAGNLLVPFFLWIVFYVVSLALSRNFHVAGPGVFLFLSGVTLFLYLFHIHVSRETVNRLLAFFVLLAFAATLLGAYFYVHFPFNRFAGPFADPASLFFATPNAYADFLLFVLPVSVGLIVRGEYVSTRIGHGIVFSVLLTGFVLSFSRGAWVAAALAAAIAFIFFLKTYRTNLVWQYAARLIPWLLLAVLFVFGLQQLRLQNFPVNSVSEKIAFQADEGGISFFDRFDFLKQSLGLISDYPWFGSGPETFQFVAPKYQAFLLAGSQHPHNFFLKIVTENGILAAIPAILFFLFSVIAIARNFLKKTEQIDFYFPLSAGLFAVLLHNMVDFNLNFVSNQYFLWIFLAFLLTAESGTYLFGKFRKTPISVMLVIFGLLLGGFSLYEGYYNIIFRQARQEFLAFDYEKALYDLRRSEAMIFKRDWPLTVAQTYKELGKKQEALASLAPSLEHNIAHAKLWHEAALLTEETDRAAALEFNKKALVLDPKNFMAFHEFDARLTWIQTNDVPNKKELSALLEEYARLLRNNAHLTVLSDNPRYAIELARLLRRIPENEEERLKYHNLAVDLFNTTLQERQKIQEKYPSINLPKL